MLKQVEALALILKAEREGIDIEDMKPVAALVPAPARKSTKAPAKAPETTKPVRPVERSFQKPAPVEKASATTARVSIELPRYEAMLNRLTVLEHTLMDAETGLRNRDEQIKTLRTQLDKAQGAAANRKKGASAAAPYAESEIEAAVQKALKKIMASFFA